MNDECNPPGGRWLLHGLMYCVVCVALAAGATIGLQHMVGSTFHFIGRHVPAC